MPDLTHTLQGSDLGFMKMVAASWGIELNAPDAHTALPVLVSAMLNRALIQEIIEALPPEAAHAFEALIENDGRMSTALFMRRFGEIRAMGAGRRDRERPDLRPTSPAEVLWYRAIIGRTFLNIPPEPQEYVYIPDDLLEMISPQARSRSSPPGRAASPGESAHAVPVDDHILDHSCTLLAALRLGIDLQTLNTAHWQIPARDLQALLHAAGLLDETTSAPPVPIPEATRAFLEAPRGEALAVLARAWLDSNQFNELLLLPGLIREGEWRNNPLQTRKTVIELLSQVPAGQWWNLPAFVAGVAEQHPDFQRPSGDYDSWFIRRESDGEFLRGISSWDAVDGALLRYIITAPLHWLGFFDLATPKAGAEVSAFRHSAWSMQLWHGMPPRLKEENEPVRAGSDGLLRLSPRTPRAVRYQIARFCQWEDENPDEYRYRLTPAALERARQQGLRVSHLITLLRRHSTGQLPPSLIQALERWEKSGTQASLEQVTLLRVSAPEALAALRQGRAGRYLGEAISPTVVVVKSGAVEIVQRALTEAGYLAEIIKN